MTFITCSQCGGSGRENCTKNCGRFAVAIFDGMAVCLNCWDSLVHARSIAPVAMTDKETLKQMFIRAKIEFEEREGIEGEEGVGIEIEDGYWGFFSRFDFNEDGSLCRVSAWE